MSPEEKDTAWAELYRQLADEIIKIAEPIGLRGCGKTFVAMVQDIGERLASQAEMIAEQQEEIAKLKAEAAQAHVRALEAGAFTAAARSHDQPALPSGLTVVALARQMRSLATAVRTCDPSVAGIIERNLLDLLEGRGAGGQTNG